MLTPPSATPLRAAKTFDPVVVDLSPTSKITLNGLLSFSSLSDSQFFPAEAFPAYISLRPTFLRSLLATRRPVAQAEAQLVRPAVTPNFLSQLESAAQKTLSPWMVAQTTCVMTLVEVNLTTSLYLGVLYLSLSCMTNLFLAKQSVFPVCLLLNLVWQRMKQALFFTSLTNAICGELINIKKEFIQFKSLPSNSQHPSPTIRFEHITFQPISIYCNSRGVLQFIA